MSTTVSVITHNGKVVHVCTEGVDEKVAELESANCLAKNFDVPTNDKWEVLEVPCD